MARVFLSYSREDIDMARLLAEDLEDLRNNVWMDQELTGGQS